MKIKAPVLCIIMTMAILMTSCANSSSNEKAVYCGEEIIPGYAFSESKTGSGEKQNVFAVRFVADKTMYTYMVMIDADSCKSGLELKKEDFLNPEESGCSFAVFESETDFITPEEFPDTFSEIVFTMEEYVPNKSATFTLNLTYDDGIEKSFSGGTEINCNSTK